MTSSRDCDNYHEDCHEDYHWALFPEYYQNKENVRGESEMKPDQSDSGEIPENLLAYLPLYPVYGAQTGGSYIFRHKAYDVHYWSLKEDRKNDILNLEIRPDKLRLSGEILRASLSRSKKFLLLFFLPFMCPLILYLLFLTGFEIYKYYGGTNVYISEYLLPVIQGENRNNLPLYIPFLPLGLMLNFIVILFLALFFNTSQLFRNRKMFWNGNVGFSLNRKNGEIFFPRDKKRYQWPKQGISEDNESVNSVNESQNGQSENEYHYESVSQRKNHCDISYENDPEVKTEFIRKIYLVVISGKMLLCTVKGKGKPMTFSTQLAILIQNTQGCWFRHDLLEVAQAEFIEQGLSGLSQDMRCSVIRVNGEPPFQETPHYYENRIREIQNEESENELDKIILSYYDDNKIYDIPKIEKTFKSLQSNIYGLFGILLQFYIIIAGLAILCNKYPVMAICIFIIIMIISILWCISLNRKRNKIFSELADLLGIPQSELKKNNKDKLVEKFIIFIIKKKGYTTVLKEEK